MDFEIQLASNTAIIRMNRGHRHNSYTKNYIKALRRAMKSVEVENSVNFGVMTTKDRKDDWSVGTDFRSM